MDNIKELVKEYCEDAGLDYREDYSGRGMYYDKSCVAITCDNPLNVLCELFAYIVDSDEDLDGCDVQYALGKPEQDSMGMSSVLYFPKLMTA